MKKIISGQTIENVSAWLHQVPQLWPPGVATTGVNTRRWIVSKFSLEQRAWVGELRPSG